MAGEEKSSSGNPGGDGKARPAAPRLFARAKDEFRFAYEHGLMTRGSIRDYEWKIQLLMPDEASAVGLQELIEKEGGGIYGLAAYQSPAHGDRWVVQLPLEDARRRGLMPVRIWHELHFMNRIPVTAKGNPDLLADVRAQAIAAQASGTWGYRDMIQRWRGPERQR